MSATETSVPMDISIPHITECNGPEQEATIFEPPAAASAPPPPPPIINEEKVLVSGNAWVVSYEMLNFLVCLPE